MTEPIDLEYSPEIHPISRPTRDAPEAALRLAVRTAWGCDYPRSTGGHQTCGCTDERIAAILAALPSCFFGNPAERDELARQQRDEITRLRSELLVIAGNPSLTVRRMQDIARAALTPKP